MSFRALSVAICTSAVFAAVAAPTSAADLPGPLASEHPCQDGFAQLSRADGTAFATPGECTSYAAQGGAVIDPVTGSSCRLGLGRQAGDKLIWTCSIEGTLIERLTKSATLGVICGLAGDTRFSSNPDATQASCSRL